MKRRVNHLYNEGNIALADGNLIRAKKILNKIKEIAPNSPMTIELAGEYAACTGEKDEAMEWFEQLIVPEVPPKWRAVGYMHIALIHKSNRMATIAVEFYRKAIAEYEKISAQEPVWLLKQIIGDVLIEDGQFQEAAETLESLLNEIRKSPKRRRQLETSMEIRTGLAEAYRLLGRLDESRQQWEKIAFVSKKYEDPFQHAAALDGLGVICQIQGQLDEAKDLHLASLQINRNVRNLEGQSVNCTSSLRNGNKPNSTFAKASRSSKRTRTWQGSPLTS